MSASDSPLSKTPPGRPSARSLSTEDALRPPLWLLCCAVAAVVASAFLLQFSGRTIDLVGYLLATLVTVLLVAGFRSLDNRRRSRPTYVVPMLAQRLPPSVISWALLGIGILVGGVHVWRFAEALARQ